MHTVRILSNNGQLDLDAAAPGLNSTSVACFARAGNSSWQCFIIFSFGRFGSTFGNAYGPKYQLQMVINGYK